MPEDLSGIDRIPESMRTPIRSYASRLRELGGGNALALTVFGALAMGDFDPAKQTVRNVLVLHAVDLDMLRQLAGEGMHLGKARIAAPLIMTPQYIENSLDAFPLEFLEIQQNHIGVFGPEYFQDLSIQDSHVRLQCERELRTMLIGMRQGLLSAGGREKLLGTIEADVLERLIRTLRGILSLQGEQDAKPAGQILEAIERRLDRRFPGIRRALDEHSPHGWDEFRSVYEEIEGLRQVVDAW